MFLISLIPPLTCHWFKHYSLYSLIAWKCVQLSCIYVCSVPWNFMVSQNVKLFPVEVQCLPNFGKLDLSCMETCPYYLLFHVKYWDSWDSGFRIFNDFSVPTCSLKQLVDSIRSNQIRNNQVWFWRASSGPILWFPPPLYTERPSPQCLMYPLTIVLHANTQIQTHKQTNKQTHVVGQFCG